MNGADIRRVETWMLETDDSSGKAWCGSEGTSKKLNREFGVLSKSTGVLDSALNTLPDWKSRQNCVGRLRIIEAVSKRPDLRYSGPLRKPSA